MARRSKLVKLTVLPALATACATAPPMRDDDSERTLRGGQQFADTGAPQGYVLADNGHYVSVDEVQQGDEGGRYAGEDGQYVGEDGQYVGEDGQYAEEAGEMTAPPMIDSSGYYWGPGAYAYGYGYGFGGGFYPRRYAYVRRSGFGHFFHSRGGGHHFGGHGGHGG
jgi:hypothetical protein